MLRCVDEDKVVVVGRHAVRAVRLADGKPAWDGRVVNFPDGGTPSGLGVLSGSQYLVPLSNNEIVGVDIAAGKIAQLSKSRRGGLPGNLICHQGKLISEGVEGVDCYWLADAAKAEAQRRLAANPNDAEALALKGEILLDAGKRSEAVASFRRAYQLQPQQRTRDLLRDALLEGLREEFAAYRGRGEEIQRLLDNASAARRLSPLNGRWSAAGGRTGPRAGMLPKPAGPGAEPAAARPGRQDAAGAAGPLGTEPIGRVARRRPVASGRRR